MADSLKVFSSSRQANSVVKIAILRSGQPSVTHGYNVLEFIQNYTLSKTQIKGITKIIHI